jgi:hypothetical protein
MRDKIGILLARGAQFFQKCRSLFKIVGSRRLT